MGFLTKVERFNRRVDVAFNNKWLKFALITLGFYTYYGYARFYFESPMYNNTIYYWVIAIWYVGLTCTVIAWAYQKIICNRMVAFDYTKFFITATVSSLVAFGVINTTLVLVRIGAQLVSLIILSAVVVSLPIGLNKKRVSIELEKKNQIS